MPWLLRKDGTQSFWRVVKKQQSKLPSMAREIVKTKTVVGLSVMGNVSEIEAGENDRTLVRCLFFTGFFTSEIMFYFQRLFLSLSSMRRPWRPFLSLSSFSPCSRSESEKWKVLLNVVKFHENNYV
jgi:hypothetical protein